MLLCSENTASMAESTQNKMILYHLSENLCLQQRRKEEKGRLQKQQVGGLRSSCWTRATRWVLPRGTAYATRQQAAQGRWHMCIADPRSPLSQVMLAKEQSRHMHQKGSSIALFLCQGNSRQQRRLLAALRVASYWILLCISEREAVAKIKLSSIWTKERILWHVGLLWLTKSTRPCKESSALIAENNQN